MKPAPPARPRERDRTVRQTILHHLRIGPLTARDLSALAGIREKDVLPHMEHLQKTLRNTPDRLIVEPAECVRCHFRFTKRDRLSKPTACPRCRSQQIDPPVFRLASTPSPG